MICNWLCRGYAQRVLKTTLDIPDVPESEPNIIGMNPTKIYGQMPSYAPVDLIEHIEFRIQIHATYLGLLESGETKYLGYGDEDFHKWAIEGYENCIYYLERFIVK